MNIILKFLVYLAKNISLRRYILKKTKLDFFFIFPRKGYLSGWGLGTMHGLSTHIHIALTKAF